MKNLAITIGVCLLSGAASHVTAIGATPASGPAIYITAKDTHQKLASSGTLNFTELKQPTEQQAAIFVDPKKTFQTFLGIGGALTDASAETFYKLPEAKQQEILTAYFDPKDGIGYSLGRTHINSCDFSSSSYTYVAPGDTDLKSFNVAPDRKYRIPLIKAAMQKAGKDFSLYVSPWSPPAWMKSNKDMLHGGKLLPEFAEAWAQYYVKFIQAYENEGIPVWGLTVQNEPMAVQTWESCVFTGEEERDFVRDHLGPTLAKNGLGSKRLIIWDHNRSMMYQRAKAVLDDPQAAKFVWGVGFHWYMGDHFENVARVQESFPKANLIFTEGCHYPYDTTKLGEWQYGELYAKSIINDLNNGAVGWTDWNILLDEKGGPNHVGNYCYAPVHGDTKTGKVTYMNSFHYIGHFSKFIRPGAKRIVSSSTLDELLTTGFVNPDGSIAVVVMNSTDKAQEFLVWMEGRAAKTAIPAHGIMTVVLPSIAATTTLAGK